MSSETAYTGLVKMHAHELAQSERYRRTGRLTSSEVHAIARDLDAIGKPHPLDETIDAILSRTDALELAREADAKWREKVRLTR